MSDPALLCLHSQFGTVPLLPGRVVRIGRDAALELTIPDPRVSRTHATVVVRAHSITLEDGSSANGVLLNGDPVGESELREGDRLDLGGVCELRVAPLLGWLRCPPLPIYPLGPEPEVLLGRGSDCDFRIRDPQISRKQARVRVREGRLSLVAVETASQPTFVNGQAVKTEAELGLGDVVTFGSCEIRIEPPDVQTGMDEATKPGAVATGLLSATPFPEVLQGYEFHGKTGTMQVRAGAGGGFVAVRDGRPLCAEWGELRDEDAVLGMLELLEGRYLCTTELACTEARMQTSITGLLLEGSRRLDDRDTESLRRSDESPE